MTESSVNPMSTVQFFKSDRLVGNMGESLHVDNEVGDEAFWSDHSDSTARSETEEEKVAEMRQVCSNVFEQARN